MEPTRRALLGAMAAATVAGCLGDADDEASPTGTSTDGDGESSATVQVRSHDELGEILVGPDGLTLYMFEQDTEGEAASACQDGCADAWPSLTVDGAPDRGEAVTAELETFEREDGSTQVMAGGWPLYYYASDASPGDANGQGANDVWWVLDPDGEPQRDSGTATETDSGSSGPDAPGY